MAITGGGGGTMGGKQVHYTTVGTIEGESFGGGGGGGRAHAPGASLVPLPMNVSQHNSSMNYVYLDFLSLSSLESEKDSELAGSV